MKQIIQCTRHLLLMMLTFMLISNTNSLKGQCLPGAIIPYQESFETVALAGSLPTCTAASSTSIVATYTAPNTFNRAPQAGTNYAAFRWGTAATGDYFYSGAMQLVAGQSYNFSTWYVSDGVTGWSNFDAWVGTSQTPTGLVAIAGASVTSVVNTTYQQLNGLFTVATSGTYYVALRAVGNSTPWYITFDNLLVAPVNTCVAPTNVIPSAIVATSATVSWGAVAGSTGYDVQYRVVGAAAFTPFAGNPLTATTANLTGLVGSTFYEVQVRNKCSAVLNSYYSFSITFTTACVAVSIPYAEGFEGITANNQLPICMIRSGTVFNSPTYIATPATPTYNRTARTGTKFASFTDGTPAGGNYFYSAPLQLTAGTSYRFSAWYITDGLAGWNTFDASVGTTQTPTGLVAIPGATASTLTNTAYQELSGIFTVPTTGVYYVALRCVAPGFPAQYLTFDDIVVELPPACIVPFGITTSLVTSNSATVSWSAVAGSTGYNVQYRAVGAPTFTAFAGNPVTLGTSVNLTGLAGQTNYEVQVQNICSTTLSSSYSGSVNFTTACAPVNTFPYFEGFEGITADGDLPNCMARTSPTLCLTYASPQTGSNRIPRTGTKFGSFLYNTVVGGNYFYSAPLALIAGKTYDFSAWYITDGLTGWTTLDAYVGPNQNPTGLVPIAGATVSGPVNITHQQLAGSFVPTTTGTYYVALRCVATFPPNYLSFDDFSVISPCVGATFTTLTLPAGSTTIAYNQTITATGGVAPYTSFSVTNGILPAGLTLNPTTGVISGTPTTVNITPPTFTVTISDATSCTTNKNYSITVTGLPCTTITVTPTTVPTATLGVLYPATAVQFAASGVAGATYTYSIASGILPSGMSLTATGTNAGRLTGTPTSVPASPLITIKARITTGPSAGCFGTVDVILVVNCPPMTFTPATISDAVINVLYTQNLDATYAGATGGFTYAVTAGALPTGFTLSPAGVLSGTGLVLSAPASITIKATRGNGCNISQTYTFGVVPVIAAPIQLDPMQISSSSFRARWQPVARAVRYRVYVATSAGFDGGSFAIGYVGLAVVGDTSILVQNLKPDTKYYIQITAISSADEVSPYSNVKDATTLSAITGIDNALSSQVKVSPNPSKDKFLVDFGTLNLGKTTARVYDAQGKQVFSSEVNTANTANQTTIPLGNMANGIYLLEIISNKGRILKRLIKE